MEWSYIFKRHPLDKMAREYDLASTFKRQATFKRQFSLCVSYIALSGKLLLQFIMPPVMCSCFVSDLILLLPYYFFQ
jgi:hypothetical protein